MLSRFKDVCVNHIEHDEKLKKDIGEVFNELLKKDDKQEKQLADSMKGTLMRNLLEFGRSVHAEMAALMDAARLGSSVKNATLYTTTFPCHLCARHIVAAGITRVVYIEPYPKSLAGELYSDSLLIDPVNHEHNHVNFEPFVGVSPLRYTDLFKAIERKNDTTGKTLDWPNKSPRQRFESCVSNHMSRELVVVGRELPDQLEAKNISEDTWLAKEITVQKEIHTQIPDPLKPYFEIIIS